MKEYLKKLGEELYNDYDIKRQEQARQSLLIEA